MEKVIIRTTKAKLPSKNYSYTILNNGISYIFILFSTKPVFQTDPQIFTSTSHIHVRWSYSWSMHVYVYVYLKYLYLAIPPIKWDNVGSE